MDSNETKIRKKPLAYARFMFGEYYACLHDDKLAADLMKDLVYSGLMNVACKHEVNQRMIDEADEFIAKKRAAIREFNKKRQLEKKQGETAMSKPLNEIPRHELEKTALENGITAADFHRWYEDTEANGFQDSQGHPIRNPLAAMRAYTNRNPKKEASNNE